MTSPVSPTALRTELTVDGMTCGNCVKHVHEALTAIPGVSAVVDLDGARATATHPPTVPAQVLVDAVADAGYEVAVRP